jgi:hypothetical protein
MRGSHVCRKEAAALYCGREVERVNLTDITSDILEPTKLARLNVEVRRLPKPIVTIDFSTIIQIHDTGISDGDDTSGVELVFELKKTCQGDTQTLKEYSVIRYIELGDGNYTLRNSFLFTYCDDMFCDEKSCIYTVDLTSIRLIEPGRIEELLVEDSAINALVQGRCN